MAVSIYTSSELDQRIVIIETLRPGRTPLEIINFSGYANPQPILL